MRWRRSRQLRPPRQSRDAGGTSRLAQDVPGAAHRVNEARLLVRFRLAAQVADVQVECVRGVAEVVPPDAFVDECAWKHLAWIAHEELEQVCLCRRELEASSVAPRL